MLEEKKITVYSHLNPFRLLGVLVPASGKKRGKQNPEQRESGERTTTVAKATPLENPLYQKTLVEADINVQHKAITNRVWKRAAAERVFQC